jgi:hypothetical protein
MKLLDTLNPDAFEATADFYYDLFDGGYIKPEHFIDEESAHKVNEAMELIRQFQSITAEVIEEM